MPVYPLNTLDFSISASAFHARRGSRGAIPLKNIVLPPANQIRRADGQKPFEKMDVANGPGSNEMSLQTMDLRSRKEEHVGSLRLRLEAWWFV